MTEARRSMTLDRIEALLGEATPGPWKHGDNVGWDVPRGYHVWAVDDDMPSDDNETFVAFTGPSGSLSAADAAYIALSRNLMPAALAVIRAAEKDHGSPYHKSMTSGLCGTCETLRAFYAVAEENLP